MNQKNLLAIGAFSAAMAVILGAMGAHALKELLTPEHLIVFKTGVTYQMYHSFGLILLALSHPRLEPKLANLAGWLMLIGMLLFSFSIYLLSTTEITGMSLPKIIGLSTPFGGTFLISSWVIFAIAALKKGR